MRAGLLFLLIAAACVPACGGAEQAPAEPEAGTPDGAVSRGAIDPEAPWPADGFLHYLPPGTSLVARLPSLEALRADPESFAALMYRLGWPADPTMFFLGAATPAGLAPDRAAGYARTGSGGWAHYLPAQDKGALNASLGARRAALDHREENNWVILSKGGAGAGHDQDDPLPPGPMALRVRYHPLLSAFANPGDMIELGVKAGPGGLEFHGRLKPGPRSSTGTAVAATPTMPDEALDHLPANLAVRVETTLPAAELGSQLAARLAVHGGIRDAADRVVVERFLREVFSGADSRAGYAFGVGFRDGSGTFVATGKIVEGKDSPILKLTRGEERSSYGPLILDRDTGDRRAPGASSPGSPDGRWRWRAWLAEPAGKLEGLPESFWDSIGMLVRGEDEGLDVVYSRVGNRFVFAIGPDALSLARKVSARIGRPFRRSVAGTHLHSLRSAVKGQYKLGLAIDGGGLRGMHESDRTALRKMFHAGEEARIPKRAALMIYAKEDGTLGLFGRLMY